MTIWFGVIDLGTMLSIVDVEAKIYEKWLEYKDLISKSRHRIYLAICREPK